MNRLNRKHSITRHLICGTLLLLFLALLGGCDDEPKVTTEDECDNALDDGDWDKAIETCGAIENDSGYSRTAQAYMGRAGIGLLGLIDRLGNTQLEGLALILGTFTVTPVQSLDVDLAIEYLLKIENISPTDSFNLIVSSDVAIANLLADSLGISVDADTGFIVIPGITDSGIENLTGSTDPADIQTVMDAVYGGTYYSTDPPDWNDSNASALDLKKISSYIEANALGTSVVDLGDLGSLDFATSFDNGVCALKSGESASGVAFGAEGTQVAQYFPRRLNTSSSDAAYLVDDLYFVLLDINGSVDPDREWDGNFVIPSRLLNPDFIGVECGQSPAGPQLGEFSLCVDAGNLLNTGITSLTESDLTTPIDCGSSCTGWPLLSGDGSILTDEWSAEGSAAKSNLARVLHQLYPVDNDDPTPSNSGLHCVAGDGYIHAREFDYYLRTFGQVE